MNSAPPEENQQHDQIHVEDNIHPPLVQEPKEQQEAEPQRATFVKRLRHVLSFTNIFSVLGKAVILFLLSLMNLFISLFCKCNEMNISTFECAESFLSLPTYICDILSYTPLPQYIMRISNSFQQDTLNQFVVFGALAETSVKILVVAGFTIYVYKAIHQIYFTYYSNIKAQIDSQANDIEKFKRDLQDYEIKLIVLIKEKELTEINLSYAYLSASELRTQMDKLSADFQTQVEANRTQKVYLDSTLATLEQRTQEVKLLTEKVNTCEQKVLHVQLQESVTMEKLKESQKLNDKLQEDLKFAQAAICERVLDIKQKNQ